MTRSQSTPFIADWPTPLQAARRLSDPAFAPVPRPQSLAGPISPVEPQGPSSPRRWSVVMADGSRKLVEARGFRIESGAVVFAEPAGCVAAFASGIWSSIEEDRSNA